MISAVIEYENGRVIINDNPVKNVGRTFEPGFYSASMERDQLIIERKTLPELHDPFKSEENEMVVNIIKNFFKPDIQKIINEYGFIHKLGILLHGDPGCGKTSLINYCADYLVKESNAVVFFCDNANTLGTAMSISAKIRAIQPEPIVFIADEFDRFAQQNESEMKDLLDGKSSIENSLFLATTNYIDRIPKTLKERLSRFRLVEEIRGITDKETMYEIVRKLNKKRKPDLFSEEEIVALFKDVNNITLDEIKNKFQDKVTNTFIVGLTKKSAIGFKIPNKEVSEEEKLRAEIESRWVISDNGNSISNFKDQADNI